MSEQSLRLLVLELAVKTGSGNPVQTAQEFLTFVESDVVSKQPAKAVKASAKKVETPLTPTASTPANAPAQSPAEQPATAPASTVSAEVAPVTASSPATVLTGEALQKKCTELMLALAKVDRDATVAILEEYKAQRFGQVKPADYPVFLGKVEGALAYHAKQAAAAAEAAKADPGSLV